ncbi:MAG: hypothetical protein KDB88_01520 [Flavobacteriales bacterium]|nr:hypothetical protein [Flavobacteriales bacterium]
MSDPYRPIDCSVYDRYEAWATLRTEVVITHASDDGIERSIVGTIVDLFIREKEEWMRLQDGTEIRLDRIRAADIVADASSR